MEDLLGTSAGLQSLVRYLPIIIGSKHCKPTDFVVGKTKMFMKLNAQKGLIYFKNMTLSMYAQTIQRYIRGFIVRVRMREIKKTQKKIATWFRAHNGIYGVDGEIKIGKGRSLGSSSKSRSKAVSASDLLGSLDRVKATQKEISELIQHARTKLTIIPKNVGPLEEVNQKMSVEIQVLEFMQAQKHKHTEDAVVLNKLLAQASEVFLSGEIVKQLETRIKQITTQLPLLKALSEIRFEKEQSPEKLYEIINEARRCDPSLLNTEQSWIKPDGYKNIVKAQTRLAQLGGWPPSTVEARGDKIEPTPSSSSRRRAEDDGGPGSSGSGYKRRGTITGLGQDGVEAIKKKFYEAKLVYDAETISTLLGQAISQGIPQEEIQSYRDLYQKLCSGDYVTHLLRYIGSQLRKNEEALAAAPPDTPAYTKLVQRKTLCHKQTVNLIKQAQLMKLPNKVITDAQEILRDTMGAASTCNYPGSRRTSVFMDNQGPGRGEEEKIGLAMHAFGDLYNYAKLRERQPVIDPRTGRDIFLDHSKQRLRAPLTYTVPDKHIGTVSQCFRNILGWMNDRPVQDAKRVILAFTVVAVARKEISLRNEIYIQAIKQCRNNPNAKSEMLGWKLLLLLSQEAAPKADLVEFIVAFFRQGVEKNRHKPDRTEFCQIAKECFKALEKNLRELAPEEQEELGYVVDRHGLYIKGDAKDAAAGHDTQEAREARETVKIEVFLMDNSSRKLRCRKATTVGELGLKMAELLRMDVDSSADFGFFQLVDDVVETHRMIPDTLSLRDLCDKWQVVQKKTGKSSRLLWKRQFLTTDEDLNYQDTSYANLTFRQAYFEYLRYPVTKKTALSNCVF